MRLLIAGATGFVGQALVPFLCCKGYEVTVLGRDKKKIVDCFDETVTALSWDELKTVEGYQAVINLAGHNIGQGRWSESVKHKILTSRVEATQRLARLCAACQTHKPRLLNASAIGIYGTQAGADALPLAQNEDSVLPAASEFLSQVGQCWEAAVQPAVATDVDVVLMRFGVVLAANGGVLKKMATPVKLGLGGRIGSGKQVLSWIALPDLVRAIYFVLVHTTLTGPINMVSPSAVTQQQFIKTLAGVLKRPALLPLPSWLVILLFGHMGKELLLRGQHVYPSRLRKAGFRFEMPQLTQCLKYEYCV